MLIILSKVCPSLRVRFVKPHLCICLTLHIFRPVRQKKLSSFMHICDLRLPGTRHPKKLFYYNQQRNDPVPVKGGLILSKRTISPLPSDERESRKLQLEEKRL